MSSLKRSDKNIHTHIHTQKTPQELVEDAVVKQKNLYTHACKCTYIDTLMQFSPGACFGGLSHTCTCMYMPTHTHIHTHTHAYSRTCTHMHTHTHTHVKFDKHTQAHRQKYSLPRTHTQHRQKCTCTRTHTHTRTRRPKKHMHTSHNLVKCEVATISRPLETISLFCKRTL